jgi:hypothetical protein
LNLAFVEDPLLATAAANMGSMVVSEESSAPPVLSPITTPTSPFATDFTANLKLPPTPTVDDDMDFLVWDTHTNYLAEADVETPHLLTHAKVYAIAEKYCISGLKSLARQKFTTQASVHFTTTEFADAMQEVYESTVDSDRGLRDVIIQAFRSHPELAQREDIEDVVRETPGLAWELFRVGWGLPIGRRR